VRKKLSEMTWHYTNKPTFEGQYGLNESTGIWWMVLTICNNGCYWTSPELPLLAENPVDAKAEFEKRIITARKAILGDHTTQE
jgi:hypothetical protein